MDACERDSSGMMCSVHNAFFSTRQEKCEIGLMTQEPEEKEEDE